MQQGRGGRGKPVSRDGWPPSGARRDWLAYCNRVRRENGLRTLRALAEEIHLSFNRVGELLRGEGLPADEELARNLLGALGAAGGEVDEGVRLYRAARAERDQEAQAAAPAGWWPRSGYVRLVGDIAPLQLLGRDDELAELADWCTGGGEPYVRWQAGPRAGKSALMSWLVLHPPPGTWVVSFFVTASLAAEADSTAFTSGLLDQLAAITGKEVPSAAPAADRDRLRRQLLEQATARAVKAGRRLVVVVDGLDEDWGVLPGSGLPSIAACLPKRPPDGLRVIVASRPDPPLPADVGPDHPLRRCPVRPLDVSPHATEVMRLAQQELDEVLAADKHRHDGLGYQVLGLVTASGGGLRDRDLERLTGRPAFEIDRLVRGVFGRTIAGRAGPHAAARMFLFTHATLREQAAGRLGPDALAGFAGCLHAWADSYRASGWPDDTPEYLLRGYPRMLADAGDAGRLAALAVDPARHRRLLAAIGGDATAVAEIAAALALISSSPSPDLPAALRLAWHRDRLTDRNAQVPHQLPVIWVTLGQPLRAEALAWSITRLEDRAPALADVARAMAVTGDYARARVLVGETERIARSITRPFDQGKALAGVSRAAAAARDYDRAERIARSITDPEWQARALAGAARAAAAVGDYARAQALADDAEQTAQSVSDPVGQMRALPDVAQGLAAAGDYDRAEPVARATAHLNVGWALADVAQAAAAARDYDRAERIARSITDPRWQARALADAAQAAAAVGDYARAQALADDAEQTARSITRPDGVAVVMAEGPTLVDRSATDPHGQAQALADAARAMAAAGDRDRARALADDAEQIARSVSDRWGAQKRALADLAHAAAGAGAYDRAERIAWSITDPKDQTQALADVAQAAAAVGDYARAQALADDAEQTARSATDPESQAWELIALAGGLAAARDYDRAERIAWSIAALRDQAYELAQVARTVAGAGGYNQAERIARSITDPGNQAWALAGAARAAAAAGDYDRARALAGETERIAQSIMHAGNHDQAPSDLSRIATAFGDYDEAERIAQSITEPTGHTRAATDLVRALAAAGDHDRAERIARSILSPDARRWALAEVARAITAAGDCDRAERIARSNDHLGSQAQALADLALAAAAGDHDRARALADDAEQIARSITDHEDQAQALADVARAMAATGDHDRARAMADDAEQIARSITDQRGRPSRTLHALVRTAAAAGDFDRAERIARFITDPKDQAQALSDLAQAAAAEQVRARSCIAGALAAGRWTIPLRGLALVDPAALSAFADELTASPYPSQTRG